MSDIDMSHLDEDHIERCEEYAINLHKVGMHPREVQRAYLYALVFGLPGTGIEGVSECVRFDMPTCGDHDCISPQHQVVTFV